jgi:SAM-dependent methyltransferase
VNTTVDEKYYEVTKRSSTAGSLLIRARNCIYEDFMKKCQPSPEDKILDVGVSDVINDGANLIERAYPYQENLTAVGLGTAEEFRKTFPKVEYHQIEANVALPFPDKHFDIVVSNAVLEHVGGRSQQFAFMADLLRVGKKVFVTVPNRFFPVEHHTAIPILHWTDLTFRLACRIVRKEDWSREENLILMSPARLRACCPRSARFQIGRTGLPLGPFSSNLYILADEV